MKKSILEGDGPDPFDPKTVKAAEGHLISYKATDKELFIAFTQDKNGWWFNQSISPTLEAAQTQLGQYLGYTQDVERVMLVRVDLSQQNIYEIPMCADCDHNVHKGQCEASDYDMEKKESVKCLCP